MKKPSASIKWNPKSREIRNRIRVAVAAYAYEYEDDSIITDAEFDKLALRIRPQMKTGKKKLDKFFATQFNAYTGSWIGSHPELDGIKRLYYNYYKKYTPEELKRIKRRERRQRRGRR